MSIENLYGVCYNTQEVVMRYTIGIDFGTLSARAVIIDEFGKELADAVKEYAHGVIDCTACGMDLKDTSALQHPDDYVEALSAVTKAVLAESGISPSDIVGLGIDFTSSTVLPVDENDLPVCRRSGFEKNPHAYVKLWKHHGAEAYADEMEEIAKSLGERWLNRYGAKLSCEFALPKIVEVLKEAPEVWAVTSRFVEAGDWIVSLLTGRCVHSAIFAGYKWCWDKADGYPSNDFFKAVDEALDGVVGTKIPDTVESGTTVGALCKTGAELTGLMEGTPISIPVIDAHSALPALGVVEEGDMMLIVGTSGCQILNSRKKVDIEGIFGCVYDSIVPGLYTYEAGQSAVGDIFEWSVRNFLSESYREEAKKRGINLHKLLREKAERLKVGESGLIALDWLNGNRSILQNPSLKGAIFGLTLNTKPEEVYRAFIEATAFGVRVIVDKFKEAGIDIKRIIAGGGIPVKDEMLMQIYSEVLNSPIAVAPTAQAGAVGSAIFAMVAGGVYPDVVTASRKTSKKPAKTYTPNPDNVKAYDVLYSKYKALHDYFGKAR